MKNIIILLATILSPPLIGQKMLHTVWTERRAIVILPPDQREWTINLESNQCLKYEAPFFTMAIKSTAPDFPSLEYQYSGEWNSIPRETHAGNNYFACSELIFLPKEVDHIKFRLKSNHPLPKNIEIHFFAPAPTTVHSSSKGKDRLGCICMLPPFKDREDWCPGGNCPEISNPIYTDVTHLVIHHTATPNQSNDWDAVVRSIWNYHVNTKGWSDIGYNWLISPEGTLYKGRGDNVKGAHFCGKNSHTMGIAMIGTFSTSTPQDTALNTLSHLLAWKSCAENIDPYGTTYHPGSQGPLPNILGHRDGCPTSCPGNAFYPMITGIKDSVDIIISGDCTSTSISNTSNDIFRILPNPATEFIKIQGIATNQNFTTIIFDVYGNEVSITTNKIIVDISKFSPGVYWVFLREKNNANISKIWKLIKI